MGDAVNPKQAFGDKKVPLGFVPPAAIIYMGLAMADGARKYGPYNWRDKPIEAMTYIHAALRHIYEYLDGVDNASDSGKPHLAHALACLGLLADATEHGNLIDNRPLRGPASALLAKHEKPVPLSPRIEESLNNIEARTPGCPDLDQEYEPGHGFRDGFDVVAGPVGHWPDGEMPIIGTTSR